MKEEEYERGRNGDGRKMAAVFLFKYRDFFFFFLICQVKAGCEVDSLETSAVL